MVSSVQRVNGNYVRICMLCGLESLAAHVTAGPPPHRLQVAHTFGRVTLRTSDLSDQ